jgi:hypothetical protein
VERGQCYPQSGDDAEADNFAAFAFGRFALFWSERIAVEESGARTKSDMTLKNAYYLQAYWKQLKKDGNCVATFLLPVPDENNRSFAENTEGSQKIQDPRKSRLFCNLEIASIIHTYTVDCRRW